MNELDLTRPGIFAMYALGYVAQVCRLSSHTIGKPVNRKNVFLACQNDRTLPIHLMDSVYLC